MKKNCIHLFSRRSFFFFFLYSEEKPVCKIQYRFVKRATLVVVGFFSGQNKFTKWKSKYATTQNVVNITIKTNKNGKFPTLLTNMRPYLYIAVLNLLGSNTILAIGFWLWSPIPMIITFTKVILKLFSESRAVRKNCVWWQIFYFIFLPLKTFKCIGWVKI